MQVATAFPDDCRLQYWPEPRGVVLSRVDVEPHAPSQCESPGTAIEVDQQTFTTHVLMGVTLSPLPNYQTVQELAPLVGDLTRAGAFRVHVERPQGDHLSIMIDTEQALKCSRFVRLASDKLGAALAGWSPDLVLLPDHSASDALADWLRTEGLANICRTHVGYGLRSEIEDAIRTAKRILLVDDALVTSRTFRALLEVVQRTKPNSEPFDVRGFVRIGRTALDSTQAGLRKRFFLNAKFEFSAALNFPLPDLGETEHGTCPWCVERRFIESALPTMETEARDYFEVRWARLIDKRGLADKLLLISDHPDVPDPSAGTSTTAGSYLGPIADLGAYVSLASLVQRVRYSWQKEPMLYDKRRVLSVAGEMRYYTDAVIAGSLLRTTNPGEIWSAEHATSLGQAIVEIEHPHQHAVLAAEVLFAINRRKLPTTIPVERFITPHPEAIQAVLRELVRPI